MAAYHTSNNAIHDGTSFNAHLPSGPCNFRDLNCGARAPTCGCKRFWLNSNQLVVGSDERAWCFCGHHACFHNAFGQSQVQSGELQPRASVEQRPSSTPARPTLTNFRQPEGPHTTERVPSTSRPSGLGIRADFNNGSQATNARLWDALNGFARQQEDGTMSLTTSKMPSTAAPSVAGTDFRQSPARDLMGWSQNSNRMPPPITLPTVANPRPGADDYQGSATEVATPSMAGTPDLRAFAPPGSQSRISPAQHLTIETQPLDASVRSTRNRHEEQRNVSQDPPKEATSRETARSLSAQVLQEVMRGYGQRIAALESLSFSQVPLEEVQERFDLFDSRLLDLEHWRIEQEQQQALRNDEGISDKRRRTLLPSENSSFNSDGSFDGNAAMHADAAVLAAIAADAETGPRIDALEDRISDLEKAALPSYSHPWQIEVVLLPWGRELRGIWIPAAETTQQSPKRSADGPEEWSGAQEASKSSFRSSMSAAWTTESIQAWAEEAQDWLSPKACGPHGTIFQRLASRGIVQNLTLTAPDASHILHTITEAFRKFTGGQERSQSEVVSQFLALREPFIPLRKVRKSSRLRFLSPAEMVTPSLWTANFLDSSVFMKMQDQHRRLYITTPEAYLQPNKGHWSWAHVKQLPPFYPGGAETHDAALSSSAIEACWTHSDRLDCPPSLHTSFASHVSQRSAWSVHGQQDEDLAAEGSGDVPSTTSAVSDQLGPRYYLHKRTASLPMSSSSGMEPVHAEVPKRRIASFETVPTVSTSAGQYAEASKPKRRRISTSPEAERRGVYFTPRLSREPPSPFTSEATAGEARSQGASSSNRRRGTTPFAYATPHSNNFVGTMDLAGDDGDGDTVHNSDLEQDDHGSEQNDEEWHGVEDDVEDDSDDHNAS